MTEAVAAAGRDRWSSITLSVLLHGALAGIIFLGWWRLQNEPRPPQPTLAIEATVVDARSLAAPKTTPAKAAPVEKPPEPAPEDIPPVPPQPTPEELAQQQAQDDARREAERTAAEEAKAREQQSQREAEERQQDETQRLDAARKEAEAKRDAEAKRAAEAKRITDEKKAAEDRRLAEEKRKADAAAREARERAQSESDLQKSLQAEEHAMTLRNNGALASWEAQITARIQRAWIRPPSARPGLDCTIEVTQVQGGQVTHVSLGTCNGDPAVRESIEAAVYRASPLPPPPDPSLFERDLQVRFHPAD